MKKVKLSEMIIYYERKKEKKDIDFEDYFQEKDIEKKLERLKLMYETIGELELPLKQIRAFLYAGEKYYYKNIFNFTKPMVKDITEIIKDKDEMPVAFLLELLDKYDEECYKEYDIKGYINKLILTEKYSKEVIKKINQTIELKKEELKKIYEEEKTKLELLKGEYSKEFIHRLQNQIVQKHIKAEEVIKLMPSPEFIENSVIRVDHGYDIKSGEDLVCRIIEGYVDLNNFEENEKIILGYSSTGNSFVYTSFTKKEYLEEMAKQRIRKR